VFVAVLVLGQCHGGQGEQAGGNRRAETESPGIQGHGWILLLLGVRQPGRVPGTPGL